MDSRQTSREWFDRAQHDWDAANFILNMRPVPVEIVCYHCQQAVEKSLKGYLVSPSDTTTKTASWRSIPRRPKRCGMCSPNIWEGSR